MAAEVDGDSKTGEKATQDERSDIDDLRKEGGGEEKAGGKEGEEEEEEEEGCGFCKFMRAGPCGEVFTQWEKCVDAGRNAGEDFVESCLKETKGLKICMEENPEYYGPLLEAEEGSSDAKEKVGANEKSEKKEEGANEKGEAKVMVETKG